MNKKNKKITKENCAELSEHALEFWCFTAWNDPKVTGLPNFLTYIIYGKEYTKEGKKHWQGYLECKPKLRASTLKNKFKKLLDVDDINITARWSNAESCSKYCKKGLQSHEEWEEFGTEGENYGKKAIIVEFGKIKKSKQGERTDLLTLKNFIQEGHGVKSAIENGYIKTGTALKTYQALLPYYEPKRMTEEDPDVTIIWGPTSCGKSQSAYHKMPNAYVWEVAEDNDKWWQGYDGEKEVIIDDFRDNLVKFNKLLKILQKFPMQVETKGGSRQLRAEKFIITCNSPPNEWYPFLPRGEDKNQLLSRITEVIEMNIPFKRKGGNKYCVKEGKIYLNDKENCKADFL